MMTWLMMLDGLAQISKAFARDRGGAAAIEYALMTTIAIAIIAVVHTLGGSVTGLYQSVVDAFSAHTN
jgi:Flp pilus assembly pilin Flp